MTTCEIVPATSLHAADLAPRLRQADIDEIWAAAHFTPEQALVSSLAASRDALAGLIDGKVIAIFGVADASLVGLQGSPWMLGSDEVSQHAIRILRINRRWVAEMRKRYARLENYVDARNTDAIKWLYWLGFELDDPKPFGFDKLPFRRFYMEGSA